MAAKIFSYDDLAGWIDNQTKDIIRCKYGRNRRSILEGIEEQKQRSREIIDMEGKVSQIMSRTYDADKKKRLTDSYDMLKAIVEKKLHCLETMLSVSSLEENCSRLSHDIDFRSVSLVKSEEHPLRDANQGSSSSLAAAAAADATAGTNISGFIATSAQDCINGLRTNWQWLIQLIRCIDIHLKNSSGYQQFFHEIHESESWMLEDFRRFSKTFEKRATKKKKVPTATLR